MSLKSHSGVTSGEALTGNMDFFTVHTAVAIAEGAVTDTASAKDNLVKIVETISTGAQPVLVSVSSAVVDFSVSGNRTLYAFGTEFDTAATTVYTLKFAVEHGGVFGAVADADDPAIPYSLAARLKGLKMPFTTAAVPGAGDLTALDVDSATLKNVTIIGFDVL